jgi:hypothetical protein
LTANGNNLGSKIKERLWGLLFVGFHKAEHTECENFFFKKWNSFEEEIESIKDLLKAQDCKYMGKIYLSTRSYTGNLEMDLDLSSRNSLNLPLSIFI